MHLSIIIPVYNSELILPKLTQEINEALIKTNFEKELIFINDFSKDNSWLAIKKITKSFNFIKGINLRNNYGQHNAIAAGLSFSTGKYVVMMDDDLQHDPVYILNILKELEKGSDACYVKYLKRKHTMWKRFFSNINHVTSSFLSNKSTKLYTSSFKGINRKICKIINNDNNFEVFLDWLIVENSKKIQTIDVIHRERLEGKTNYDLKKLLILWSNMILKIKAQSFTKKLIIFFIKKIITFVIYKFLKKRSYKEKFIIYEKTF